MENKVFRSRISLLYVPIFGTFLCLGSFISGINGLIIFGVITVLCFFVFRSLYYVLTEKEIQIYCCWGILGKPIGKILISGIISVERSYNPLPAQAASLKRLHIHMKKGRIWQEYLPPALILSISPVHEQEFLETLKILNHNIQINVTDKKGWWRFWDWDI